MPAIALIVTDLAHSCFGHAARLGVEIGGAAVLAHTVRRAARVKAIDRIAIVHPAGQDPLPLIEGVSINKPVSTFAVEGPADPRDQRWVAARKWALTCWRGGLGTATVYDELLPPAPLAAALDAHQSDAALIVRGDWCAFDPNYAEHQLAMHLEHPEAFKLTFTQAPPGLAGIVTSKAVLEQFAEHHAGFGQALGYNPRKPHVDPIGREVCHPVPASVRDTNQRFIYDTPRGIALLRGVAERLGDRFADADASAITDAARAIVSESAWKLARLPQQVTLELTPRRPATGPITPQHHVAFDRPDLDVDLARRIFEQLADTDTAGDVAVRLGGLGDALEHPRWDAIVTAAHEAGVLGIGLDTDLRCDQQTLDRILALPIDVISVRLNADTAATYKQVMGEDAFGQVARNLQYLFQRRGAGLPWLVPRLVKTPETLRDMESFFDRWMLAEGHAVIEPAQSGVGLMPELSPVPMAPPRRSPCRQLGGRMTILADGRVALCDQDWLGRASLGEATTTPLIDIWQRIQQPLTAHAQQRHDELTLCGGCSEWHRP